MEQKSLEALEYPKVIKHIAELASFSAGREAILSLQPSTSIDEVRRLQQLTTEAKRWVESSSISIGSAHDIRPGITLAERGGSLDPVQLVEIGSTIRSSVSIKRSMKRLDNSFPHLHEIGETIPETSKLSDHIELSIGDDGTVLDSASPMLRQLRQNIRIAGQRLQSRLQEMVGEFKQHLQEPIITIRSDRYVLPVKVESQSQIHGIIHDRSASGVTVFIEPLEIVDLNNRLRDLHLQERNEIARILLELSSETAGYAEHLKLIVEILAEIDLHLAKAKYSLKIMGTEPELNTHSYIDLRNARHPLIQGKVVPISFQTGRDYSMVVITGPNTGGKTVSLKTIGLLTLMAQSGIHIPVDQHSHIAVMESIYADIGDDQSIAQNLSTFSSHMAKIVHILGKANSRSLVLLDEVGAGTDPTEGAALAQAILSYLHQRNITTVATTHYSEIKVFAHNTTGVANASVEFDIQTLAPTYQLQIGLPGRSNALAIAKRIGLSLTIIESAREYLGEEGLQVEILLHDLEESRKRAEREASLLSEQQVALQQQLEKLTQERKDLEAERAGILNQARQQAQQEIEEIRQEISSIRVRKEDEAFSKQQVSIMLEQLNALSTRTKPIQVSQQPKEIENIPERPDKLHVGDSVRVRTLNQIGDVIDLSADFTEADVALGNLKIHVPISNLEYISKRQAQKGGVRSQIKLPAIDTLVEPAHELDIRGQRAEEALDAVDRYLNELFLAGSGIARIIHGKGTGALRQAIRNQLAHHPLVQSFTAAAPSEGGDGATTVIISSR